MDFRKNIPGEFASRFSPGFPILFIRRRRTIPINTFQQTLGAPGDGNRSDLNSQLKMVHRIFLVAARKSAPCRSEFDTVYSGILIDCKSALQEDGSMSNAIRGIAVDLSSIQLNPWVTAVINAVLILIVGGVLKWILSRLGNGRQTHQFYQVLPYFDRLVYIVAAGAAIEAAPLSPRLALWLGSAVYISGVIVFLLLVRRAVMLGIEWTTAKTNHSATLQQGFVPLMRNVVTLFVFTVGSIMILKHLNYDVMSLITALGVGSLAVGLAAKDTLSNMISGFTLIIDRNLRPGDRVNLGGQAGEVEEIGLRSTRIKTGNGNTLIVPNSELVNTKIMNLSQPSRALACTVTLKFPIDLPFEKVHSICLAAASEVPLAMKEKNPWANLSQLGDQTQTINVGFWIDDLDQEGKAISEFNQRLLRRLHSQEIVLANSTPQINLQLAGARNEPTESTLKP